MIHARAPAASAVNALQVLQAAQIAQAAALIRQRDLASRAVAPEHVALDPDIAELVDHFHISDKQSWLLHEVMQSRKESFAEDLDAVWKALEKGEEEPVVVLAKKIMELRSGHRLPREDTEENVAKLAKKYKLDEGAASNLLKVMEVRERIHGVDVQADLTMLETHLGHSSAPSKLISVKLKDMFEGCEIGGTWPCCAHRPRKKKKGADSDETSSASRARRTKAASGVKKDRRTSRDEGGVGGITGRRHRPGGKEILEKGMYGSFTDLELDKRFGAQGGGDSGKHMMTEKEAMRFQESLRGSKAGSSRRSRSRGGRSRKRERGRSSGRGRKQKVSRSPSWQPQRYDG